MSKEQVICRKVLREIRHLTENSWEGGNWERMIYKCRLSGFSYKKHWDTSVCRCFGFKAGFCDSKDKTKQNEHFIITQCYGSTRRCIFQRFPIHFLDTKQGNSQKNPVLSITQIPIQILAETGIKTRALAGEPPNTALTESTLLLHNAHGSPFPASRRHLHHLSPAQRPGLLPHLIFLFSRRPADFQRGKQAHGCSASRKHRG